MHAKPTQHDKQRYVCSEKFTVFLIKMGDVIPWLGLPHFIYIVISSAFCRMSY